MRLKLTLKVLPHEVFYQYEPAPPERARWSSLGTIYPGGVLLGIPYDELQVRGTGDHILELDTKAKTLEGAEPIRTEDEIRLHTVRFALFMYEVGADTLAGCECVVILKCTDTTAAPIRDLLPRELLDRMTSMAHKIPENIADRKPGQWQIFSSNGTFEIPDGNLVAIRRHFLPRHQPPAA